LWFSAEHRHRQGYVWQFFLWAGYQIHGNGGVFSVGNISGGAFNPAVAVGTSIMGLSSWANIWIYLVADLTGGVAAADIFKAPNPGDK
jgi:glycerol uptake facilitator-like aquaporin